MRVTRRAAARVSIALAIPVALALFAFGCSSPPKDRKEGSAEMSSQPIAEVLATHTPELMALPGVMGVYQSALPDGTPCIKVILLQDHPQTRGKIPATLEGYSVRIEESDRIRPVNPPSADR